MRILTTIILGAISVFLGIVISAVEWKPREGGREISFLLKLDPKAIETIKLRKGNDEIVIQQQQERAWFFVSPDHEVINLNSMMVLLNQLNQLRVLDEIGSKEWVGDLALDKIGLTGDDALHIEIQSRKGKKTTTEVITLGRPVTGTNHLYCREAERNKVSVVSGNPLSLLQSPYDTLLEKKLILAPPIAINQIAVKTLQSEFVIQRKTDHGQSRWEIAAPIRAKADQIIVEDFLQQLLALQIEDVFPGADSQVSLPNPLPKDAVMIQYLVSGSPNPILLYLEKEPQTDTFALPLFSARSSDRPSRYLVRSQIIDHIPLSVSGLREKTLGIFPERAIESIALLEKPRLVLLTSNHGREGSNWEVTLEDGSRVPANYTKIRDLIEQLNQPLILDFIQGNKSDYGIDPDASGAIRLGLEFKIPAPTRADGSETSEERFSKVLDLGWKNNSQGNRQLFASFRDDDQIFRLKEGFVALLPSHPIKWRSLRVLKVSQFHVTSMARTRAGESLVIHFDKSRGTSEATLDDVPAPLDPVSARMLRDRLATLEAQTWVENPETAEKSLDTPYVTFEIEFDEFDASTNEIRKASKTLRLAEYKSDLADPKAPAVILGRVDDQPEIFILDREAFRALIRPVTGGTLNPAL